MIKTLEQLAEKAAATPMIRMAVACAADEPVLEAVRMAYDRQIVIPVLVGDEKKIHEIAEEADIDVSEWDIIDETDKTLACEKAVHLISEGKAEMVMKGMVDTSVVMKAVLNKEAGLRKMKTLSHTVIAEVERYDRLFYVTDSALNIAPDFEQKVDIVKNAVSVAHAMGNDNPKVALLCAVEKVNPKMQCTIDADEIAKMNARGEISGCTCAGPLALDNAVSDGAAKHKGVDNPVAGKAEILMVPDIEAGNMLIKSMEHFGGAKKAGVIMGAKIPIVLTSRASAPDSKLYSIALGKVIAENKEK